MEPNIACQQLPVDVYIVFLHDGARVIVHDFNFPGGIVLAALIVLMEIVDNFNQVLDVTFEVFLVVAVAAQPELRNSSEMLKLFEELEKGVEDGGFFGGHHNGVEDQLNVLLLTKRLHYDAVVDLLQVLDVGLVVLRYQQR